MLISVAVCTLNPRPEYFEMVLSALADQTLSKSEWELIVVDNGSTPPLDRQLVGWHPNGRLIREMEPGLTPARVRAIRESSGDLIVFVDDDNLLDANYLEQAIQLLRNFPMLAAIGGSCFPRFETTPHPVLKPWLDGLVVEVLDRPRWANLECGGPSLPPGAGLVVRRAVAERYCTYVQNSSHRRLLDRRGGNLSSGGDSDLALTSIDLGYGTGRFPELRLTHLIPKGRLEAEYLIQLQYALAYSGVIVNNLHQLKPVQKPSRINLFVKLVAAFIRALVFWKGILGARIALSRERGRLSAWRDWEFFEKKQLDD